MISPSTGHYDSPFVHPVVSMEFLPFFFASYVDLDQGLILYTEYGPYLMQPVPKK